jgi:hypothetical protein
MKTFSLQRLLHCLILTSAIALSSCGYVSDKPPVNLDLYKTEELQGCKIDITKLSEIFKADQKEQIKCLEENFIQFTKYVRSKDSGAISETELNAFIKKFFQGQSDSIVKGLSLIFQLNMLLLRDEASRISRTNISPLFELLVKVNQEAIIITQVLKDMNDEANQGRFWELRAAFIASVTRFSEGTIKIIEKSPGIEKQLNIKKFILDASQKLGNKEIDPQTIDSLIFLKRFLVGGEKEIITSDELKLIIGKLPKILNLSFDLYFVKNSNFSSDADHSRFYLSSIRDLYSIIQFNQNDFELFTIDQILYLAEGFIKDKDIRKFKPSIISLKSRLIGGNEESISLKDLKAILDISNDFVERKYFNQITYSVYRNALEKNSPILSIQQLDLPNHYDVFSLRRVTELHKDFEETAINIRYFRNEKDLLPSYGNEIKRTRFGFLEVNMFKWVSVKLAKAYGHKNTLGIPQISMAELQKFLFEMKPILEEFKLWSPTPETFARNTILLGDLFQNTSNGDLEINVNEATEYIQMILSAVEISNRVKTQISTSCDPGINPEDPLFDVNCFNTNFFEALLDKSGMKKNFPRLTDYVLNNSKSDVEAYLSGVEGFARDDSRPGIPINKRDQILIVGALLNIESTFIRFDANRDNIIDYKELLEAFKVYRSAIITMAKLQPSDEKYAQSIFLYMVSKMQIPQTGSWTESAMFLAYDTCVSWDWCREHRMDKIEAKRLNIGKLLFYMVNQNAVAGKKNK